MRLLLLLFAFAACGDDEPTPDAALPLCRDLGCNTTLCTDCETTCMGERCYVPGVTP